MPAYPNRNALWAGVFVDELIRAGLTDAVIAPGSRSTPLTFAFSQRSEIRIHSLIDERSAAFFALGLAQAAGKPAALVCTSGTAAANFFPAIVEASQNEIPMLVLTADRPPELYDSGSNQVVDQVKIYGNYARWFMQMPTPEARPSQELLAALRTIADRAMAVSLGLNEAPGPVHLNFPFRKPLEPVLVPEDQTENLNIPGRPEGSPWTRISLPERFAERGVVSRLQERIQSAKSGLIVCGLRCPGGKFPAALTALAGLTGFPILADPLSNLRFGPRNRLILGGYDTFLSSGEILKTLPNPELVLRFGDLPTSAALMTYLAKIKSYQVAIGDSNRWMDDMALMDEFIKGDALSVVLQCSHRLQLKNRVPDRNPWLQAEAAAWQALDETGSTFEGAALAEVMDGMPDDSILFIANSLPIRHLDQFARPVSKRVRILGNRGASGIDGTISSALGAAAASHKPLVLVCGDLSFYHDMNGLLAFKRSDVRATIVLIHNDGGGIFQRLPAAQFDPPFTELFLTPHGLDFAPAAEMYGVEFQALEGIHRLGSAVSAAAAKRGKTILQVRTDSAAGEKARRAIIKRTGEIFWSNHDKLD